MQDSEKEAMRAEVRKAERDKLIKRRDELKELLRSAPQTDDDQAIDAGAKNG